MASTYDDASVTTIEGDSACESGEAPSEIVNEACESGEAPSQIVNEAEVARLIHDASKVVVLTGAGISTDSGIPTFRGEDGYWTVGSENYAPEALATWSMYDKMPAELWRWYQYRWGKCRRAKPNPGHWALMRLQSILSGDLTIVTQNVDGLHLAAGSDPSRLHEIHGRLAHMRCDERVDGSCLHGLDLHDPAVFERARATVVNTPMAALDEENENLPLCQKCGVRMRPKLLWFDENYNEPFFGADSALNAVEGCDLLIVVGTQLCTALPGAIVATALANGAKVVRIDPVSEWAVPAYVSYLHLKKRSTEALTSILACLEQLRGASQQSLTSVSMTPSLAKQQPVPCDPDYPRCLSTRRFQGAARREDGSDPSTAFDFQIGGETTRFRVTVAATGSREACDIVARACFTRLEEGRSLAEVTAFRDECCSRMRKGRRRLTSKVCAPHVLAPRLPTPATKSSDINALEKSSSLTLPSLPFSPVSTAAPSSPSVDSDSCAEASPRSLKNNLLLKPLAQLAVVDDLPQVPTTPKRSVQATVDLGTPEKRRVLPADERGAGSLSRTKTSPSRLLKKTSLLFAKPSVNQKKISTSAPRCGKAQEIVQRVSARATQKELFMKTKPCASKKSAQLGSSQSFSGNVATVWQRENPKLPGSAAHSRYEQYKRSTTVRQALERGALKVDIFHDFKKGFLKLPVCRLGSVRRDMASPAATKKQRASDSVAAAWPCAKRANCRA